jgi:hypothetical protein
LRNSNLGGVLSTLVALLLKAALIQVSDYRLLGASGFKIRMFFMKSLYVHHFLYFKREFFKTLHPGLLPYNEMHILTEV